LGGGRRDFKSSAVRRSAASNLDERRAQVGLGPEADYLARLQKLYLPAGTQ
jgi:hypothetical protein